MSSLLDETMPETTADVLTTATFGAMILATTENGGIGVTTTVMISGVNDLATMITKSTRSSVSSVDVIIKTTIKP